MENKTRENMSFAPVQGEVLGGGELSQGWGQPGGAEGHLKEQEGVSRDTDGEGTRLPAALLEGGPGLGR